MQSIAPDDLEQISRWHFAVGGLESQQEVFELGGAIQLRRLRLFPTHDELAEYLGSLPVAGTMAQYGEKVIRHELVIDAERFQDQVERIFPTAEAILAGLRIQTQAEIVCPAVCERSWAALKTNPPVKRRAYHVERGHSHHELAEPKILLPEDMEWVRNNLITVIRLTENENFQTALEALCTYMLGSSDRMKVAQLWAGVEAIFDVEHELSYRVSTLTARLLHERSKECREIFSDMRTLYGERSKIIHGKQLAKTRDKHDDKVRRHIDRVRARLSQLLTKLIDLGKVPSEAEFEELIFQK